MSGAEAVLVITAISSIIDIISKTKEVYSAAQNAEGLPKAFEEVAACLPVIDNILRLAKQYVEDGRVDKSSCEGVEPLVGRCKNKAKALQNLFEKAIPAQGVSEHSLKKYITAVKTVGKAHKVESLMADILRDIQLVTSEHGMHTLTTEQTGKVTQARKNVSAVEPSVEDHVFQDNGGITANNHGDGPQYVAKGKNVSQGEHARQFISGGAMTIEDPRPSSLMHCANADCNNAITWRTPLIHWCIEHNVCICSSCGASTPSDSYRGLEHPICKIHALRLRRKQPERRGRKCHGHVYLYQSIPFFQGVTCELCEDYDVCQDCIRDGAAKKCLLGHRCEKGGEDAAWIWEGKLDGIRNAWPDGHD